MKLYETLEVALKKEPNYVTDNGELKKWVVINKAQNYDAELIGLLLDDKELKAKFFLEIKGVLVFNQSLFVQFLEQKNYLNDSYTIYKNKVGLNIDGRYLKQLNEVALVWPFKDCVLEGGQSREEDKREEIFFNEILAQDEINQLLEPKVLTNAKRYTAKGEKPLDKFNRNEQGIITENLILKGNNLLALHTLKEEFTGNVKLIYIDPPYNTEGDSFKYNDKFTHSSWLTFIKNRIEVAKKLLKDDGVIFIQVGDEEVHYLKVLTDDIFGRENFINTVARVAKTASNKGTHFAPSIDFILCYSKNKLLLKEFYGEVDESLYKKTEIEGKNKGQKYRDDIALYQSSLDPLRGCVNQRYFIKAPDGSLLIPPGNAMPTEIKEGAFIPPPTKEDKVWRWSFDTYFKKKDLLVFKETKTSPLLNEKGEKAKYNIYTKSYLFEREETGTKPRNYLDQFINRKGADYIKKLDIEFNYSKPVELIEYLISIVNTEKTDIVLDFFAGSGTTAEAVLRVNSSDEGKRQFILCEQMDYIETVTVPRVCKVMENNKEGEFVYLELKKYNQIFVEQIESVKDTKALLKIWEEMKTKSFLNYNVDLQKQEAHIEGFKALTLAEQKQHLVELLDKNQLYVNLSSLNDKDFAVSAEEKKATKEFYQMKDKK
jgi:adenine-specific DNA-methyltransferase